MPYYSHYLPRSKRADARLILDHLTGPSMSRLDSASSVPMPAGPDRGPETSVRMPAGPDRGPETSVRMPQMEMNEIGEIVDSEARRAADMQPFVGAVGGGVLGTLGGSALGALIQAARGKSILKGLGYGGLIGLGLGGAGGTYRGIQSREGLHRILNGIKA